MGATGKLSEIICVTSFDETTEFLKRLLETYQNKRPQVLFFNLGTQTVDFDIFVKNNSISKNAVFVFSGHGGPNALFVKGTIDKMSVFYDQNHFTCGPKVLAAFACLAGLNLGSQFIKETNGYFFGYDCEISFIDKPEYSEWWEKIFHSIMDKIFTLQGVNDDLISEVRELYEDVIEKFDSGPESFYDHALFMRMFLGEQLDGLYGS